MRLFRQRQQEEQGLEVDLSPLIDVTFLLLIFFVLTTSFSQERQLEIERPSASSEDKGEAEPLRVALDAQGTAYLGGNPVAPWLLQRRVEAQLRATGARQVLLIADVSVPSGRLVDVIDQCRLAGARSVAMSTRKGGVE